MFLEVVRTSVRVISFEVVLRGAVPSLAFSCVVFHSGMAERCNISWYVVCFQQEAQPTISIDLIDLGQHGEI
jgi:hypothetical protein